MAADLPGVLLSQAQRAELQRRVADAQARPDDYVNWDEAYSRTIERLSRWVCPRLGPPVVEE